MGPTCFKIDFEYLCMCAILYIINVDRCYDSTQGETMLSKRDFFKTGEIVNLAEEAVYEELKALISRKEIEFCQCDKCLFDIACVVLNNLPSLYSSSIADRNYPSPEFKAEYDRLKLLAADELPLAIERIKGRLHH